MMTFIDFKKQTPCPFKELSDCDQYSKRIKCFNYREDGKCGVVYWYLMDKKSAVSCANNFKCSGTLTLTKKETSKKKIKSKTVKKNKGIISEDN